METDLLAALFDKDRAGSLKRVMAEQFESMEGVMDALEGPQRLDDHHRAQQSRAQEARGSKSRPAKRRSPSSTARATWRDMEKRLVDEFHLKRDGERWLTAWDLAVPGAKSRGEKGGGRCQRQVSVGLRLRLHKRRFSRSFRPIRCSLLTCVRKPALAASFTRRARFPILGGRNPGAGFAMRSVGPARRNERGRLGMACLSINEMTTYRWSFEEDVTRYRACGIEAIGVWRQKLADFGEDKGIELVAASGLAVSNLLWAGGFTGSDGHTYQESLADANDALHLAAALKTRQPRGLQRTAQRPHAQSRPAVVHQRAGGAAAAGRPVWTSCWRSSRCTPAAPRNGRF